MRAHVMAAGIFVGLATAAVADPASLLAPDDPANGSGWRPPPRATEGLQSFAPVEAKNWLELNRAAGTSGGMGGLSMPGMKGGGGGGMKDMPGMEHGR